MVIHDPRLASSRLHADLERLRVQAGLSWAKELKGLALVGLRDGMSILEVGSGPGFVTEQLLEAFPNCAVTALELDPDMCAVSRSHLSRQAPERLEIVEGSILMTDFADESFDFALARFVFQHLSAPDLAMSEILRVLKPEGTLAIVDVDDAIGGLVTPQLPAFEVVARRVRQVQAASGGDREVGRALWRRLADAGFSHLALDALVFQSHELGLQAFLPQYDPERYRAFVVPGGLTTDEWDNYRAAYAEFIVSPDAFILQLILLASGRKPYPVLCPQ